MTNGCEGAIHPDSKTELTRRELTARLARALGLLGAAGVGCGGEERRAEAEPVERAVAALSGPGTLRYADTAAELRAITGGMMTWVAILAGSFARGDGGGGVFFWDQAAAQDNGGTILNAGSGSSAGWRRLHDGVLSVKWFGARGDGISNDTAPIQSAIAAAQLSRGQVRFPAGTYLCSGLIVTATVLLRGDGREGSTLKLADSAAAPLLRATASITVLDLGFDGNMARQGANSQVEVLSFDGTSGGSFIMEGCRLVNPAFRGLFAVHVNQTLRITRCEFRDARQRPTSGLPSAFAWVDSGAGNVTIVDNVFGQTVVPTDETGPAGVVLQGDVDRSLAAGSSMGLSATVAHNFFHGVGAKSAGYPLGCVDVYNWVGKLSIVGNRIFRPSYTGIKIANSSAVIIAANTISDASWQFGAPAILYTGAVPHPGTENQPFADSVIADNIIRNFPAGGQQGAAAMHAIQVSGTPGKESLGHSITGNIIDGAKGGIALYAIGDAIVSSNVIRKVWGSYGNGVNDGSVNISGCVGDIVVQACVFRDNQGYDVIAQTGNSALRLTVEGCSFYQNLPALYSVYAAGLDTARILANQMRGGATPTRPLALIAPIARAYVHDNAADSSVVSLGATSVYSSGNTWSWSGPASARPASAVDGTVFFDTALGRPIWRRASSSTGWSDATGAAV